MIAYSFLVCDAYHKSRTIPLYQTVCKNITKDGDVYCLFGSDYDNKNVPIIVASETDDYLSAINKQIFSLKYMYNTYNNADYYFWGDDDTFVNTKNLYKFLPSIQDNNIYGYCGNIGGTDIPHAHGGAGFTMSRKTLQIINEHIEKYGVVRDKVNSDSTVGLIVNEINKINKRINFITDIKFQPAGFNINNTSNFISYHLSYYLKQNSIIYYSEFNKIK